MSNWISQAETLRESFRILLRLVATGIPGYIVSFDSKTQYAQVQIAIKELDNETQTLVDSPLLIDCYVQNYGGKWSVETEIEQGDEGMIHFSQRCVDSWLTTGGIADNPRPLQTHDFSDSFFYPGAARSEPQRLQNYANNGIRLRNNEGTHYIWIKKNGDIQFANDNCSMVIAESGHVVMHAKSFDIKTNQLTNNGINIGYNHNHTPGTFQAGGDPVTGRSGNPE